MPGNAWLLCSEFLVAMAGDLRTLPGDRLVGEVVSMASEAAAAPPLFVEFPAAELEDPGAAKGAKVVFTGGLKYIEAKK